MPSFNNVKRKVSSWLIGLLTALLYVLIDRNSYVITHLKDSSIYFFILIIIWFVSFLCLGKFCIKKRKKYTIGLWYITVLLFSLLFSTILEGGDLRRCISIMYPILAVSALIILYAQNIVKFVKFINIVAYVYFMLAFINLIMMIIMPAYFGDSFFLGGENLLGYPLLVGLLYNALSYRIGGNRSRFILYGIIHFITIVLVWSGATILGYLFIICCLYVPFVKAFVKHMSLALLVSFYASFFTIVVFFNTLGFFEGTFVESLVVDILGKDFTFSGRIFIWVVVVAGIYESPLWGHGIRETGDLFSVHVQFANRVPYSGTFSAHNQILQTWYEGGVISIIMILIIILQMNKQLKKYSYDKNISLIIKSIFIAYLLMVIGEAPGLNAFSEIVVLCFVTPHLLENYEKNKNSLDCYSGIQR